MTDKLILYGIYAYVISCL